MADLSALTEEIFDQVMVKKVWPGTRALTQMHLDQGQRVWLVTAAPVEIATVVAQKLGQLARRARSVGARRNHLRIGPPLDLSEDGIIAPVEEFLHLAAEGREVFRRRKQVPVRAQQVIRPRLARPHQPRLALAPPTLKRRPRHRLRRPGPRMPDDQEMFHAPSLRYSPVFPSACVCHKPAP